MNPLNNLISYDIYSIQQMSQNIFLAVCHSILCYHYFFVQNDSAEIHCDGIFFLIGTVCGKQKNLADQI